MLMYINRRSSGHQCCICQILMLSWGNYMRACVVVWSLQVPRKQELSCGEC